MSSNPLWTWSTSLKWKTLALGLLHAQPLHNWLHKSVQWQARYRDIDEMYSTRCLQLREIETDDHDFLSSILFDNHVYKRSLLVVLYPPERMAPSREVEEQVNLSVLERHQNNQYIALGSESADGSWRRGIVYWVEV
jgi:hypothetical protein